MKRILSFLLLFAFLVPVLALAEVDVKSLSTDELIALRLTIVQELMDRGEMKSATVPVTCSPKK